MTEMDFRIRPYTKRELATLYFPMTANPETAVANLRNLMRRNETLMQELAETGYSARDKTFTPLQVGIIVRFLGEP